MSCAIGDCNADGMGGDAMTRLYLLTLLALCGCAPETESVPPKAPIQTVPVGQLKSLYQASKKAIEEDAKAKAIRALPSCICQIDKEIQESVQNGSEEVLVTLGHGFSGEESCYYLPTDIDIVNHYKAMGYTVVDDLAFDGYHRILISGWAK